MPEPGHGRPTDRPQAQDEHGAAGQAARCSGQGGHEAGRRGRVVVHAGAAVEVEGDEALVVGCEDGLSAAVRRSLQAAHVRLRRDEGIGAKVREDRRHALGKAGDEALASRDRYHRQAGAGEASGRAGAGASEACGRAGARIGRLSGDLKQPAARHAAQALLELSQPLAEPAHVVLGESRHESPTSPRI